jgi:hypothetical protein
MTVIDLPRTRGKPPRLRGAVPDAGSYQARRLSDD